HASAEASAAPVAAAPKRSGRDVHAARKEVQRLERALEKLDGREAALHEQMAAAATDHEQLRALQNELGELAAERERLEASWLETSELLEA
ncbi:MAG: ABC transporter ATP-binding protein, partial [Baekduiaceae bacterium]